MYAKVTMSGCWNGCYVLEGNMHVLQSCSSGNPGRGPKPYSLPWTSGVFNMRLTRTSFFLLRGSTDLIDHIVQIIGLRRGQILYQ
jgi:hypothetical protein